jgi:hypothetical protein
MLTDKSHAFYVYLHVHVCVCTCTCRTSESMIQRICKKVNARKKDSGRLLPCLKTPCRLIECDC